MTVLVVHRRAAALDAPLRRALPDETIVWADRLDGIAAAVAQHRPEVVFCIKSAAFMGPALARLVHYPSVRWVHVGGSGIEHLGPWDDTRVTVTNSADTLAPHLAESWLGAVTALEGGLLRAHSAQAERRWGPRRFRTLQGQRLLLVGLGVVGSRVARRATEAGMQVEAVRAHPERGGAPAVFPAHDLDERLGLADIVSLHLRLTEQTHHLFDAARLARIRPGALFVNTARGGLVDEAALAAALARRHLRGAWLDVFETEPLPADSPLWGLPDVLLTPHAADQVEGWDLRFVDRFAQLFSAWRAGDALPALSPPNPAPTAIRPEP